MECIMKQNYSKLTRWIFLLSLLSVLTACGFQLRGNVELPALYQEVHIVDRGNSDVKAALSKALTDVGSRIVSSPGSATAVITILSRGIQRRALNVGGKRIREYELQLEILFVVQNHQGKQISEPQKVSIVRSYQNDVNNVLAKDNEEAVLRKEMMRPAMGQMLHRLKAIAQ